MQLTDRIIRELSEAIFAVENPFVVEAYSEFNMEPLSFSSHQELEKYIAGKVGEPKGLAQLFVVYPEMGGKAVLRKIDLAPEKIPDHKFRYTWEGWGLISVLIASPDLGIRSNINANTEVRADKWSSTHPEYEAPSTWNWRAISKHKNRLQRILKKVHK